MIDLAGDCAVPVEGYAVRKDKVLGFMMRRGKGLRKCQLDKKETMHKLIQLVDELHGKGTTHGDIKSTNVLMCSDGKIRPCGFGGAFLQKHANYVGPRFTPHYISPFRARHLDEPLTAEDDLFALGAPI